MDTLSFQPILGPTLLILMVIVALGMLLIGPSFKKLAGGKRWTLSLLRLGVILMAFLTVLRPGCVQKIEKNQAAVLILLLDVSRSMDLPHISDESTRWNTVVEMLKSNRDRLQTLADNKIDVRVFQFDSRSEALEFGEGVVKLPDQPSGSETDIGAAIYYAGLEVRDRRLLAVIAASDGVQNVLDPEVELVEAAESLREMEVPLISVLLGAPGEDDQLADVAITRFAEQLVVNKKSDLVARATLVARGYANQDIQVDLVLSNGLTEQVVATEIVRPDSSYQEIDVPLKYQPNEPGEYRLTVRAAAMPGELALRNNSLDGFLTVRDEGMRVLMISGGLGWEQKALRDSLPALDFVDLDFRPVYTTPAARQNWPLQAFAEEFSDKEKYDVFILCNLDSRVLYDGVRREGPLRDLAEAVKGGKGLLMIGGSHSFGPGLYHRTPLADVLPVKMAPNARQEFDVDIKREYHVEGPVALVPTGDSFLTRIDDGGADRETWKSLPPLVGANRITPNITSTVYLQSDDEAQRPILVGDTVGGRVLAFAGDSTWRWRMQGREAEFDQFWRQLILWLAFWDSRSDERVSINLPKRRFSPKADLKFGVTVNSVTGDTVEDVTLEGTLELPNGRSEPIRVGPLGETFSGQIDPNLLVDAGVYRVRVVASHSTGQIGVSEREFVVIDQDKEKANPNANPEQMTRLANQTSEFGGKAIEPDALGDLLDEYIDNPPMKKIEIPTKWRIGETMTDGGIFLALFVGLLAVEWYLRKKWGLV